jgi:hypothetical protein
MEYGKKTQNHGKWETYTWRIEKWRNHWKPWKWEMHNEGPVIWRENWKSRKMRKTHLRTWNISRKTKNGGKFKNVHCRTWNMARKLKIMENEKHPLDDLKNDKITEKREKWEMHTVGPGIWRGNLESRKMRITLFG